MDNYILWENDNFIINTPHNPHIAYNEGLHIIVSPKREVASAWDDTELAANAFKIASEACKVMKGLNLAPWFNIQANGNWGLLPNSTPFFHIHIYGRNKTLTWGKPIVLPEAPNTYRNDPMPENDRNSLIAAFKAHFA